MNFAKIIAIPDDLDYGLLIESMLNRQFMLMMSLKSGELFLATETGEQLNTVADSVVGFELDINAALVKASDADLGSDSVKPKYCVVFNANRERIFDNVYKLFAGKDCYIFLSFVPADKAYVERTKNRIESRISGKQVRVTKSLKDSLFGSLSSVQHDIYNDSDEKKALTLLLDSMNRSLMENGAAYRTSVVVCGRDSQLVYTYIKSKSLVLEENSVDASDVETLFRNLGIKDALPLDLHNMSLLISFPESVKRISLVGNSVVQRGGDVVLGTYLESGVKERDAVNVDADTLNLGCLITGLPGAGKTFAAMNIVSQAIERGSKIAVVSPTDEWNMLAHKHGINVISLYKSKIPINFFSCDSGISTDRFYENLAAMLSVACDAGPYTKSLEKVLLSAFQKLYANTRSPDPVEAYYEIENAIVAQHAKKTNVSIEYTKHGENIKAALESMRLMLMRPEFAATEGINFKELLEKGAVFDLSSVSNKMKPFFYALILNKVYGFVDSFDTNGDSELRLLICIEEAQLALRDSSEFAVNEDLKQRIQDFRKKGVGLLLVTHNVTDIDRSIRRLCQTKLYFRQSSDVAKYAADDLTFNESEKEKVTDMLKSLGHRICAANYVCSSGKGKSPAGSVFIKVPEIERHEAMSNYENIEAADTPLQKYTTYLNISENGKPKANNRIELHYVGEKIYSGTTDSFGNAAVENTIRGKRYILFVLGDRKKDMRKFDVIGGERNKISLL